MLRSPVPAHGVSCRVSDLLSGCIATLTEALPIQSRASPIRCCRQRQAAEQVGRAAVSAARGGVFPKGCGEATCRAAACGRLGLCGLLALACWLSPRGCLPLRPPASASG